MPFFVRIITPRCCFYTGHVTAGGSICIEALVNTGGPGGWQVCALDTEALHNCAEGWNQPRSPAVRSPQPTFSFESIITLILTNMVDCESMQVREEKPQYQLDRLPSIPCTLPFILQPPVPHRSGRSMVQVGSVGP